MIVDRLRATYVAEAEKRTQRPNPTGSRVGACTASLQQLAYPDLTKPEPYQPRSMMVFDNGNALEAWLAKKIEAVYPATWGLRGQPFYLPVPVPTEALDRIAANLRPSRYKRGGLGFWGWIEDGFVTPMMRLTPEGKWRIRGIGEKQDYLPSVVLDRKAQGGPCVWVAVYIDGMIGHDGKTTLVEIKQMSTPAFRRAVLGDLDYKYRCQLVAELVATGADEALWICHRKETSHMAEVLFTRNADRVRVTLTAPNGSQEVYFVEGTTLTPVVGGDPLKDFPPDLAWETAEVWTPWDTSDLASIHQRVLDVLLAKPNEWKREYGPDFQCGTCGGTGSQSLAKTTREPLKKGPKPCEDCGTTGLLDRVELPWNCNYCPTAMACWSPAGVERTIDTKPHLWLTRAGFEASGITVYPVDSGEEE